MCGVPLISTQPIDLANVRLVAGVDVSVKNEVSQAAVVVLSFPDLQIVETVLSQRVAKAETAKAEKK